MKYAVAITELLLLVAVVPAILAQDDYDLVENNVQEGKMLRLLANEITKSSEKLNKFHQNE